MLHWTQSRRDIWTTEAPARNSTGLSIASLKSQRTKVYQVCTVEHLPTFCVWDLISSCHSLCKKGWENFSVFQQCKFICIVKSFLRFAQTNGWTTNWLINCPLSFGVMRFLHSWRQRTLFVLASLVNTSIARLSTMSYGGCLWKAIGWTWTKSTVRNPQLGSL